MTDDTGQLSQLLSPILGRFCGQNGAPPPEEAHVMEFAARLSALIAVRGLSATVHAGGATAAGELSSGNVEFLFASAVPAGAPVEFKEAAKQLVKACFYPEFTVCRDSYCAAADDGACRRQELPRVRKRVSGSHCVDCPHWVALDSLEHDAFLRAHWRGDPDAFEAHRDVFLPEDFRAFRRWVRAKARKDRPPQSV